MTALLTRFLPHLGLAALLALASLGLILKIQTGRLETARRDLAIEKALHETDLANVKAAQAQANADWLARISRIEQANRRLNDEADHEAAAGNAVYVDRVLRLPAAAADPDLSRTDEMPRADTAAHADRPGGDALLLARSDALICAANTARLQAAHDWAQELAAMP